MENLFTFGVDAQDVDRLREERKDFKDYDPRWKEAFKLIYDGTFGDKEYFKVPPPPPLAALNSVHLDLGFRNTQSVLIQVFPG